MQDTITTSSMFGDKEVTRGEFMKQWLEHTRQLRHISWSLEWQEYIATVLERVSEESAREFDKIVEQNKAS